MRGQIIPKHVPTKVVNTWIVPIGYQSLDGIGTLYECENGRWYLAYFQTGWKAEKYRMMELSEDTAKTCLEQ